MPKWGLTASMRKTEPWGLAERPWLLPGKVFTDPIQGDIYLTGLEVRIVDSAAFQRLRKVRQLGTTHLVYPGATHTRFAHSLGALRVAQDLMDVVIDQRSARTPPNDLFRQWEIDCGVRNADSGEYTYDVEASRDFDRRLAKAIILVRLGALLHDLCHVPYGHSIEDELLILTPHDKNEERFARLWEMLPADVRGVMDAGGLTENLRPLILPAAGHEVDGEYRFVEDVVGNTICADLLDYLRRDHLFTGLPLALGRRYEAGFYVLPEGDPHFGRHMVLRIHRRGQERLDAVSEILKHLRYRYELSERALFHHAKLAADAMVGKALEMWHDAMWVEEASRRLAGDDPEAPALPFGTEIDALRARLDESEPIRSGDGDRGAHTASDALDQEISREIDQVMTQRGDDGLLEFLRELPDDRVAHFDNRRRRAVATLASDLERRALYKLRARQAKTSIGRRAFFETYGPPRERRRIERAAAAFAGIDKAWWVVLWIPPYKMKLKLAEVLVDDGEGIKSFVQREGGQGRGTEIYRDHERLWAVSVYMHPDVTERQCQLALASLSADLESPLPAIEPRFNPQAIYDLPPQPHDWRDRIAVSELRKSERRSVPGFDELSVRRRRQIAARGDASGQRGVSLDDLISEYRQLLD